MLDGLRGNRNKATPNNHNGRSDAMKLNYTQLLNTFLFRREWGNTISLLSDAEAGMLIKAIIAHTNGQSAGKMLEKYPKLRIIACVIIGKMEKSAKRFLENKYKADDDNLDIELPPDNMEMLKDNEEQQCIASPEIVSGNNIEEKL